MTTGTILDTILEHKHAELARHRQETPLAELEERVKQAPAPLNFSGALMSGQVRLIAEIKRASPSKGLIAPDFDPVALATTYAAHGAAAISVLTEVDHFQGSLDYLDAVRGGVGAQGVPVLRKDFLDAPYQLYAARAHGADAALLIVAMLQPAQLKELLSVAKGIWLQALVEVHDERELETALEAGAEIIGVNHRNLKTFEVDMALSVRLRPLVPPGKVMVAESGISSADDVRKLKAADIQAVLVGEALMTAPDTAAKVRELSGV